MSNRLVTKLTYGVIVADGVDYEKAQPISDDRKDFTFSLQSDLATFVFKAPLRPLPDARQVAEDFLAAWSIFIGIEHMPDELRFRFHQAEYEPVPERPGHHSVDISSHVLLSDSISAHIGRGKYPSRPDRFTVSPDVETMYQRFTMHRQNREPLTSMAYMCLTVLLASAGGRKSAAKQYSIRIDVLNTLGELASTRGGPREARKTPKSGKYVSLTSAETTWILTTLRVLIKRLGEWAYDPAVVLPQITMDDLPKLTP